MPNWKITRTSLSKYNMEKPISKFSISLTPLAVTNDLKQGILEMVLNEREQKLVTIGYDRVIMIWDIRNMLL
jgi:hypothetical protein